MPSSDSSSEAPGTAERAPAPRQAHSSLPWIDFHALPHVVHRIAQYADDATLFALRQTSHHWCDTVHKLLTDRMLVLTEDGCSMIFNLAIPDGKGRSSWGRHHSIPSLSKWKKGFEIRGELDHSRGSPHVRAVIAESGTPRVVSLIPSPRVLDFEQGQFNQDLLYLLGELPTVDTFRFYRVSCPHIARRNMRGLVTVANAEDLYKPPHILSPFTGLPAPRKKLVLNIAHKISGYVTKATGPRFHEGPKRSWIIFDRLPEIVITIRAPVGLPEHLRLVYCVLEELTLWYDTKTQLVVVLNAARVSSRDAANLQSLMAWYARTRTNNSSEDWSSHLNHFAENMIVYSEDEYEQLVGEDQFLIETGWQLAGLDYVHKRKP